MRYRVWDSDALATYDRAGLTRQQRAFAEGLLRSLEVGTYLSEHVGSARSIVLALTRAQHVLHGYAREGQPTIPLTRTVLSRASTTIANGTATFTLTPSGSVLIYQAQNLLNQVIPNVQKGLAPALAAQYAQQIDALIEPANSAVRSLFTALWDEGSVDDNNAAHIRGEVSALVALSGREGVSLQVDLLRALNDGLKDANAIGSVLWPDLSRYRVAMIVFGTRTLEGLELLLPGSEQRPIDPSKKLRGLPHAEAKGLVGEIQSHHGSSVLIIVPVSAVDTYGAVRQARRDAVEALDQYAAGQRLAELVIGRRAIAMPSRPFERALVSNPVTGGTKAARPLTRHWPLPLRTALRMAHLAGRMDAPVASTMLAWSALESMGIKQNHFAMVAKACALHGIRQQILGLYKSVTDSANAKVRLGQSRLIRLRSLLRGAEQSYRKASESGSVKAKESMTRHQAATIELQSSLVRIEAEVAQIEKIILPAIEIIRDNLLNGGDPGHPLNTSSWTLNLNDFVDALLPLGSTSSSDVNRTKHAFATLAVQAGGLAEELFETWSRRVAQASLMADWLADQEDTYHELLAWMYASRNQAIHTGQFTMAADVLTAQAAERTVDMVLEFLGHWYEDLHVHHRHESDALSILQQLADRKDYLSGKLRAAVSCEQLNVDMITALGVDCWGR